MIYRGVSAHHVELWGFLDARQLRFDVRSIHEIVSGWYRGINLNKFHGNFSIKRVRILVWTDCISGSRWIVIASRVLGSTDVYAIPFSIGERKSAEVWSCGNVYNGFPSRWYFPARRGKTWNTATRNVARSSAWLMATFQVYGKIWAYMNVN